MFSQELALKAALVDDLPMCSNGDTARIYAASWSLQPYVGACCRCTRTCSHALADRTPTARRVLIAALSADIVRLEEIRRSVKAEVDACAAAR